jgi:hypothetical protein
LNIGLKGIVWSESCFDAIDINKDLVYQVTKEDLIGDIKDFPIEVVQKMVERQVEQGNKADISVFQKDNEANIYKKGFNWYETSEGVEFWNSVIHRGYFNVFFQKHPKQKQLTIDYQLAAYRALLANNGIGVKLASLNIVPIIISDINYTNETFTSYKVEEYE